eukprot:446943_1
MDTCLACLLLSVFTETYIVYQILIYAPFYIVNETHALDSQINLFVALTLSSYPLGLVMGHKPSVYIQNKHGPKKSLLINFMFNMLSLIIMSDTTVFDRSIYHFVIGNFIMGLCGNSWANILSISSHLCQHHDYKHNTLYCYISISHGIGVIFAGLIGAFLDINNGIKIQFMDTPFIIAISCCATTIVLTYFKLDLQTNNNIDSDSHSPLLSSAPSSSSSSSPSDTHNVLFWFKPHDLHGFGNTISVLCGYDSLSLLLWIVSLLIASVVLSFDILFPSFCSISSMHGGMGWNSHLVGLFYTLYAFSWLFLIIYRYWKLNSGYSVATSFTNSSPKILKFNCFVLLLIYGVIFPFCINSAAIHHTEWTPLSWLFLGIVLAVLLGVVSASTSYHIAQSFYDLILNELQMDELYNDADINGKVHRLFIVLSNSFIYIRILLPLVIQFMFVVGVHLNHTMIQKHLHSSREWYQIGNFVFYALTALSFIALVLLMVYDKKRREKYGDVMEQQEMSRLIKELRQEQNVLHPNRNRSVIEDHHGLGFWLAINSKSVLCPSVSQATC